VTSILPPILFFSPTSIRPPILPPILFFSPTSIRPPIRPPILPPILFFSHISSYISLQIPTTMSDNISIPAANSAIANNTEPSPEFIEFARKLWEAQQRASQEQQATPSLSQEAAGSPICMLCFPFTVAFHSQCLSVLTMMMFY
jgi:hypothetical protein